MSLVSDHEWVIAVVIIIVVCGNPYIIIFKIEMFNLIKCSNNISKTGKAADFIVTRGPWSISIFIAFLSLSAYLSDVDIIFVFFLLKVTILNMKCSVTTKDSSLFVYSSQRYLYFGML